MRTTLPSELWDTPPSSRGLQSLPLLIPPLRTKLHRRPRGQLPWVTLAMNPPADPRDPEELDEAVVCAEARGASHLQDTQGGPVGGHGATALLRAYRAPLQEGRLLLQTLPPAGPVCVGCEGEPIHRATMRRLEDNGGFAWDHCPKMGALARDPWRGGYPPTGCREQG